MKDNIILLMGLAIFTFYVFYEWGWDNQAEIMRDRPTHADRMRIVKQLGEVQ